MNYSLLKSILFLGIALLTYLPKVEGQIEVWPGDANNNGQVNNIDLLYVGYAFGASGPARMDSSTTWNSQMGQIWQSIFPIDSTNVAFADCDGNGVINQNDQVVIEQNYGLTNPSIMSDNYLEGTSGSAPALFFESNLDTLGNDDTLSLDLHLGDQTFPVTDFYGIAFTLTFDTSLVREETFMAQFSSSWVDQNGLDFTLKMVQNDSTAGSFDIVLTRTNQFTISGFGSIGTFSVVMEGNVSGRQSNTPFIIEMDKVALVNNNLELQPVALTDLFLPLIAGIRTYPASQVLSLYPNPAKDYLIIDTDQLKMRQLTLYNMLGQAILQEELKDYRYYEMALPNLASGLYLISIMTNKGLITRQLQLQ